MKIKTLAFAIAALLVSQSAHAQLQSQVVAGSDNGSTRRILKTDSSGRLEVIGSAAGGSVYGPDAIGGAGTQPPVRIGGSATNATGGTINALIVDTTGAAKVSGGVAGGAAGTATANGLMIGGSDGTFFRNLNVNNQGTLRIIGESTSGVSTSNINLQVGGYDGTNNRVFSTDTSGNSKIVGNVASGSADSGNPVKIGGRFNSSFPTFADGQRGDLQLTSRGLLIVSPHDSANNPFVSSSTAADAMGTSGNGVQITNAVPRIYNGSTFDRARAINGISSGDPTGVTAVSFAPTTSINQTASQGQSTATESSRVLKSSGGNLYRLRITTGAVAGYLMLFNATSAPADGAVTPQSCTVVPASATTELDWTTLPARFSTGITAVFSSTGCFTKTASATAMFEGFYQ